MITGDDELSDIKAHVTHVLRAVDARIMMEYSVLIASALLICFPPCLSMCIVLIMLDSGFVD